MTIGEKIQMYRKQLGMSQDELGQKLFVSRQTISLWEKDQTVPTIDNLIRLREIFGVSVDNILGLDNTEHVSESSANEVYKFNFDKKELKAIQRLQSKEIYKKPIIFALICVFMIVLLCCASTHSILIGFVFGMLSIGVVSHIKGILAYNNAWRYSVQRITNSTYEYLFLNDHIGINIYHNNEKIRQSKCYYSEIERIQQFDRWILLQFGGQNFILRKDELKENSVLFSYMYNNPSRVSEESGINKWKFPSRLLFVASILSIFGALFLVGIVSKNIFFIENLWLFFLFTPIPIASTVLGFVLKSKGYKYKKNIIVGIIMTALLCVYGSFTYIFADFYDHSDAPIIKIEQTIGIDIPTHKQIYTQDWTKGTQSVSRGYIYSTSDIFFEKNDLIEFEREIKADEKWSSAVSNELIGIFSPFAEYQAYDYVLIYNMDTYEYNTLPQSTGNFRFINILYDSENSQIKFVEYDIDYIK